MMLPRCCCALIFLWIVVLLISVCPVVEVLSFHIIAPASTLATRGNGEFQVCMTHQLLHIQQQSTRSGGRMDIRQIAQQLGSTTRSSSSELATTTTSVSPPDSTVVKVSSEPSSGDSTTTTSSSSSPPIWEDRWLDLLDAALLLPIRKSTVAMNDTALTTRKNAADLLLAQIRTLREQDMSNKNKNNNTTATLSTSLVEWWLEELLVRGPDRPSSSRGVGKWMGSKLTRYSRRARLASLRRTLDYTTPPSSSSSSLKTTSAESNNNVSFNDDKTDDEEDDDDRRRRRRRALIQVLRTISSMMMENTTTSGDSAVDGDGTLIQSAKNQKGMVVPAIRRIELMAWNEYKASTSMMQPTKKKQNNQMISMDELLRRRPIDLETPKYTVLQRFPAVMSSTTTSLFSFSGLVQRFKRRKGSNVNTQQQHHIEIRHYDPYTVCSVSMNANRAPNPTMDATVNEPAKGGVQAFGALAGYLFGKNQQQIAMKMTSPVFMSTGESNNNNPTMSFVLPSQYWNASTTGDNDSSTGSMDGKSATTSTTIPQPLSGSGVIIEAIAPDTRAVLLFGGYAINIQQRQEELLRVLSSSSLSSSNATTSIGSLWEIVPGAAQQPVLAQYNDPFTPPWKRLNEISISVQQRRRR